MTILYFLDTTENNELLKKYNDSQACMGLIMIDNYEEKWISISEAAEHLGVTVDSIRNWIKKTDIPAHRIGKLWKFKKSELDLWVKSGKSSLA
jgi:excisionase family DNA binding protein